jgi:hypothetical protein
VAQLPATIHGDDDRIPHCACTVTGKVFHYIYISAPVLNCTDGDIKFQLVNKASLRSIIKNTVKIQYLAKNERDISSFV